jgi:multicomponent Na+:H+ antiporter subunit G
MIAEILVLICILIGLIFNTLGIIGLLRFPDVYTRMHATTKSTTFGSIFLCLGVIIYGIAAYIGTSEGQYIMLILHTALAVFALAITNAVGAHALARAAHRSGQMPNPGVVDRLAEADL